MSIGKVRPNLVWFLSKLPQSILLKKSNYKHVKGEKLRLLLQLPLEYFQIWNQKSDIDKL